MIAESFFRDFMATLTELRDPSSTRFILPKPRARAPTTCHGDELLKFAAAEALPVSPSAACHAVWGAGVADSDRWSDSEQRSGLLTCAGKPLARLPSRQRGGGRAVPSVESFSVEGPLAWRFRQRIWAELMDRRSSAEEDLHVEFEWLIGGVAV